MFSDNSSSIGHVELAIRALTQALEKLYEHDYDSAQVMVALTRQILEDLQMNFELHLKAEDTLRQLLERPFE